MLTADDDQKTSAATSSGQFLFQLFLNSSFYQVFDVTYVRGLPYIRFNTAVVIQFISCLKVFCIKVTPKPISQLRFDYDTTTVRLYDDTMTHSTTTEVIMICVRFDYNTTMTKNFHVHFLLASN